jgi:hypothetical protein
MPADVRERVKEMRQERLRNAPPVIIPEELADRPAEAIAWKRQQLDAIADGQQPPLAIEGSAR